jgi:hypothetical protein
LPSIGDEVTVDGIMLKVLELDGHRIVRVKAMSLSQAQEEKATDIQQEADIPAENEKGETRKEQG